jgi:hypothetical protein
MNSPIIAIEKRSKRSKRSIQKFWCMLETLETLDPKVLVYAASVYAEPLTIIDL